VIDSERQLAGLVVDEDTRSVLERLDHMTLEYLHLIDAILTLPETLLENEYQQRIAAINTIVAYCDVEESAPSCFIPYGRLFKDNSLSVVKIKGQNTTLSRAILLIKTDKKPTICFVCLGNLSLILRERIALYINPGSLSRHFLRKHIKKLQDNEYIDCRICGI
jgi:Protein of unknown function (DUF3435)